MSVNVEYNKNYKNDINKMNIIVDFFNNYKSYLNKKSYKIYQNYIPKLLELIHNLEEQIGKDINSFEKNDSDNENNYTEEYKNCVDDDSVSEYDTDTDDENTNELRKRLIIKNNLIKKKFENYREKLPIKIKKMN
jgi:hypothetical protein